MAVSLVLNGIFCAALVLLVLVLWSLKRHVDPVLSIECRQGIAELMPTLAGLTHAQLSRGNAVELLENEDFFDAMFEEIAAARVTLHFETFLWKEGALGARLAAALAERSRAGVKVRVLVDADGGKKMGEAAKRELTGAGCRLAIYHRKSLRNLGLVNQRDHRKLMVVDGRVALAGGHCIVDSWLGQGQDKEHFRDIGVRLRGPVVHALQSAFSENWVDETAELFVGDDVFPELEPQGDCTVHVARVKPQGSPPAVKILYHLALCLARDRLWIQNPYFLPDSEALQAMVKAVQRGVDVRVMVPAATVSDMPIVQHAAHRNFARLLAGGVRIFEYQRTLIHQKVMMVDGAWCAIGSSNFDDRSLEINDEITLGFHDAALAARLEAIFERDMLACEELKQDAWARRGGWHKLKDQALYLFNEQL